MNDAIAGADDRKSTTTTDQAAQGNAGNGATPTGAFRPDGLPDNFYGSNDRETVEKMWPALRGFMKEKSERGTVPQQIDDYNFNLSEKAAPYIQIDTDDKLMPKVKGLAQKWGMSDKMYAGFMGEFFDTVVDLGLIEAPLEPNSLFLALGASKGGTDEHKITQGAQRLNQAQAFINNLSAQSGFDQSMKDELALMTVSEPGVKIIEWLMKGTVNRTISPGGSAYGQAPSKGDLMARRDDPRNDRNSPKYDPNFANETIELYKKLHGDGR